MKGLAAKLLLVEVESQLQPHVLLVDIPAANRPRGLIERPPPLLSV